jgi:hypothetical protein
LEKRNEIRPEKLCIKPKRRETMTADFDSIEDAIEDAFNRCPWCVVVPTDGSDDPDDLDIFGPFTSRKEAEIWSWYWTHLGAVVLKMTTPEVEILCRKGNARETKETH